MGYGSALPSWALGLQCLPGRAWLKLSRARGVAARQRVAGAGSVVLLIPLPPPPALSRNRQSQGLHHKEPRPVPRCRPAACLSGGGSRQGPGAEPTEEQLRLQEAPGAARGSARCGCGAVQQGPLCIEALVPDG